MPSNNYLRFVEPQGVVLTHSREPWTQTAWGSRSCVLFRPRTSGGEPTNQSAFECKTHPTFALPQSDHPHIFRSSVSNPHLFRRYPPEPLSSPTSRMLARSSLSRATTQCLRTAPKYSRAMAAAAGANPFQFEVSDAQGIKIASRDDGAPTTSLALVVRGGSRYETAPGLAHALQQFTWKVGP